MQINWKIKSRLVKRTTRKAIRMSSRQFVWSRLKPVEIVWNQLVSIKIDIKLWWSDHNKTIWSKDLSFLKIFSIVYLVYLVLLTQADRGGRFGFALSETQAQRIAVRTVREFGSTVAADLLSFGLVDELITTVERTEDVLGGLDATRYMFAYNGERRPKINFKVQTFQRKNLKGLQNDRDEALIIKKVLSRCFCWCQCPDTMFTCCRTVENLHWRSIEVGELIVKPFGKLLHKLHHKHEWRTKQANWIEWIEWWPNHPGDRGHPGHNRIIVGSNKLVKARQENKIDGITRVNGITRMRDIRVRGITWIEWGVLHGSPNGHCSLVVWKVQLIALPDDRLPDRIDQTLSTALYAVAGGQYVRRAGRDVRQGQAGRSVWLLAITFSALGNFTTWISLNQLHRSASQNHLRWISFTAWINLNQA